MAGITLEGVAKRFGGDVAVHPLDLSLPEGALTVLVGPSGCGKTTTLRMLAGLESPTSGRIRIGDRDVTDLEPRDRNVAMVFQNYALYPHLDVAHNMAFGLEARRVPRDEITRRVDQAAEMLGITPLKGRKPKALSGGQQQRVAIARAIVREPSVFLFDEPLSNLDAKLRVETRTELLRLQRRLAATMVYVTHDQEEAMILADELVVMNDGVVQQHGPSRDVYLRPANVFVARFVGSPEINLFPGGFGVPAPGGAATLGVRPDDVHRAGALRADLEAGRFPGRIDVIELLGSTAVLHLDVDGREVRAVVGEREVEDLAEGATLEWTFDARRLHWFREDGARLA